MLKFHSEKEQEIFQLIPPPEDWYYCGQCEIEWSESESESGTDCPQCDAKGDRAY